MENSPDKAQAADQEEGFILLADDDPVNRQIISHLLLREGYEVIDAENGLEALQIMEMYDIDLVLTDIDMPEMNGFELLERLKGDEQLREIPVIVLSAMDELSNMVRCIDGGAEDFILKSLQPKLLKAKISASLERKRLRQRERAHLEQLRKEKEKSDRLFERLRSLKEEQDGDYFLTSLLLQPLSENRTDGGRVRVDFLTRQYKSFTFRKWHREIGGDMNIAHNLELSGRPCTVFLNGDAMGKSSQGAGGALVLGSVFSSIIQQAKNSPDTKELSPFEWIEATFRQLQLVFDSFDGAMLVSIVLGVVDEKSGDLWHINAEHPKLVLYRMGHAEFVPTPHIFRKLGSQMTDRKAMIACHRLEHRDILIAGSDGRDDIMLHMENGERVINEDENLFLKRVEESGGDLEKIRVSLERHGTLTDDLALGNVLERLHVGT